MNFKNFKLKSEFLQVFITDLSFYIYIYIYIRDFYVPVKFLKPSKILTKIATG